MHKEPTVMHFSFSVPTISLILYNRSRCQLKDCTGHQHLERKFFKKQILDILLTYIQRKRGWQAFFRKGRKLKVFCQVHKEVLGTSNSLGKPLYVLVTWWYLPGPQSQWQQPIVSSSLSASHLKTKQNPKTPTRQQQNKTKKIETETSPLWIQHTKPQTECY